MWIKAYHWSCPKCKASGNVKIHRVMSLFSISVKIEKHHKTKTYACNYDASRLNIHTIFNPELEPGKSKRLEKLDLRDRIANEIRRIRYDFADKMIDGEKTEREEDLIVPWSLWFPIRNVSHYPFDSLEEIEKEEDRLVADRILKIFEEYGVKIYYINFDIKGV